MNCALLSEQWILIQTFRWSWKTNSKKPRMFGIKIKEKCMKRGRGGWTFLTFLNLAQDPGFEDPNVLKGPYPQKLSQSMLYNFGHWSLWHRSFLQQWNLFWEKYIFANFLAIVGSWNLVTGKELGLQNRLQEKIWGSKIGYRKRIGAPKSVTGKEKGPQIWLRKKKRASNMVT